MTLSLKIEQRFAVFSFMTLLTLSIHIEADLPAWVLQLCDRLQQQCTLQLRPSASVLATHVLVFRWYSGGLQDLCKQMTMSIMQFCHFIIFGAV